MAMASALYGTVLGSLIGGWPTDRFGRKATLLGWACSTLSQRWEADSPTASPCSLPPASLAALASAFRPWPLRSTSLRFRAGRYRGRLAGMFQFNIVFGILDRVRVERIAGRHWERMPGGGCLGSRRFLLFFMPCLPRPSGKSALAFDQKG